MKYGDTSGGGAGATATGDDGRRRLDDEAALVEPRRADERSPRSRRSPSTPPTAPARSRRASRPSPARRPALTETLTYTAPAGGLSNGTLTVAVPAGWTRARDRRPAPASRRPTFGVVSVAGQTITVSRRHAHRRPDGRDHVRLRRDGDRRRGARRTDLAGHGGLDRGRRAHRDRRVADDHDLRARRLGDRDDADDERLRVADGKHRRLHVHGRDGRHVERRRQADDSGRLERAVRQRRRAPATRRRAPAPSPSPARS